MHDSSHGKRFHIVVGATRTVSGTVAIKEAALEKKKRSGLLAIADKETVCVCKVCVCV